MNEAVVNEREKLAADALMRAHVPITQTWLHHNAFLTSFFNASSVTIPHAERITIDSVEEALPRISDETLLREAQKIIHEEAAHYRVHDAYNEYLARLRSRGGSDSSPAGEPG